jgi:hypothetical protein
MCYRPTISYDIAIGLTSVAGPATTFGITNVRLQATADCYVTFGVAPVASVTTSMLIRSSGIGSEIFTIAGGESIAVISGTAGGALNVTEMTG